MLIFDVCKSLTAILGTIRFYYRIDGHAANEVRTMKSYYSYTANFEIQTMSNGEPPDTETVKRAFLEALRSVTFSTVRKESIDALYWRVNSVNAKGGPS